MARRVSLSRQNLALHEIATHHADVEQSILEYYAAASMHSNRFAGYTLAELGEEREQRLAEEERLAILSLLASVEAAFRVDFCLRVAKRDKYAVSGEFQNLDKRLGRRVLFEHILDAWSRCGGAKKWLISELRASFRYRHWLAHGRYWTPKLGRNYDYLSVYMLAEQTLREFPLLS